jgi:hypothetical protein
LLNSPEEISMKAAAFSDLLPRQRHVRHRPPDL